MDIHASRKAVQELNALYAEMNKPKSHDVEEGYKEIDKKKETAMYRRAGNLARQSLASKGKEKETAQNKSANIVSAITRQKEKERFSKMADIKARDNYREEVEVSEADSIAAMRERVKRRQQRYGKSGGGGRDDFRPYTKADYERGEANDPRKKVKESYYDPMEDPDFDHDEAEKNRGVSGKNNPKGGKALGKKKKMKEGLDPVGREDADIDNDGDVDKSDKYLHKRRKAISKAIKDKKLKEQKEKTEITEIHGQAHKPHEVPSKNLKGLVSKAVKRIDTDVDGDTDHNDKAKGELGEFIPGVGNKRLYSTTGTKTAKESFSNWRNDLREIVNTDEQEKQIKEKSVKNKVVIDPELKLEAIANELGAEIVEVIELDEGSLRPGETYMQYAKRKEAEKKDTRMTVSAADKKANTPAYQNYKKGDKRYKMVGEESVEEYVDEATAMAKRGYDEAPIRQKIAKSTGGGQAADRATKLADKPTFGNDKAAKQRSELARKQRGDFRKTTSSSPGLHGYGHKSDDPKVKAKQAARGAQRGALTPAEKKQLNREEFEQIDEKAMSRAQQRFMGMVYAAKKGETPASPEVAKAASGMSKKAAKDFAGTKHKGLPEKKVAKEELELDERTRYAKETGKDPQTGKESKKGGTLGGDDRHSKVMRHVQKDLRKSGGMMSSRKKPIQPQGKKKEKGAKGYQGQTPVDRIKARLAKKRAPKPDIGSRFD